MRVRALIVGPVNRIEGLPELMSAFGIAAEEIVQMKTRAAGW
jgi:hypothetical protein